MTVKEGTRSLDQNAKLWAMLSDIAQAKPEGRTMAPEMWKAAFMSALGYEIVWQPGIDNAPAFPAGFSGSVWLQVMLSFRRLIFRCRRKGSPSAPRQFGNLATRTCYSRRGVIQLTQNQS